LEGLYENAKRSKYCHQRREHIVLPEALSVAYVNATVYKNYNSVLAPSYQNYPFPILDLKSALDPPCYAFSFPNGVEGVSIEYSLSATLEKI
jgi:hypothetical protein